MDIRSIHPEELQAFSHVSEQDDLNSTLETYLSSLWQKGASRPEWCFVAQEGENVLGRVVYWAQPSFPLPQEIDFLDVPWTGSYLEIGEALLRQTLTQFHTQGVDLLKCAITSPSRLQREPEKHRDILTALGFELRRESDRWQTHDMTPRVPPHQLIYRSVSAVGMEAFRDAFQQTLQESLDRGIQQDCARLGLQEAAQQRLNKAKALLYQPSWWHLAYTPEEQLIGVIIPSKNDGGPIIDYVGVVPTQRGHGYVDDLLIKGMDVLRLEGARRIRSDSDQMNIPSGRAFLRVGFKRFQRRWLYSETRSQR